VADQEDSGSVIAAVPVLRVANVARSAAWYQEVLGFSGDSVGSPVDPSFASVGRDGVELMLQKVRRDVGEPRSARKAGGGWDVYLRVSDAQASRESIRKKLLDVGPMVAREYGCQEFEVSDPDGHVIVLGECG